MDTGAIMALALEQAGLDEVPADSAVHVPGTGLSRALFGVDIDVGDRDPDAHRHAPGRH